MIFSDTLFSDTLEFKIQFTSKRTGFSNRTFFRIRVRLKSARMPSVREILNRVIQEPNFIVWTLMNFLRTWFFPQAGVSHAHAIIVRVSSDLTRVKKIRDIWTHVILKNTQIRKILQFVAHMNNTVLKLLTDAHCMRTWVQNASQLKRRSNL